MSKDRRQLRALAPALLLLLSACPSLKQVERPGEGDGLVVGTKADDLWVLLSMTNQALHRLSHRDGGGWKPVPLDTALAEQIGDARLAMAWASEGKAWLAFRNGGPTELLRIDPAGVTEDFNTALQEAGLTGNPFFHRTASALYLVSELRPAGDGPVQTVARLTNDGPVRVAELPPGSQLVSVLDDTHLWASTGSESFQLVEGEWKALTDGPFAEGTVPELRIAAANDVFATIGNIQSAGSLWHYDGVTWTEQALPAADKGDVRVNFVAVGDAVAAVISVRDQVALSRRWNGTQLGSERRLADVFVNGINLLDEGPGAALLFGSFVRSESAAGVPIGVPALFLGYRESL